MVGLVAGTAFGIQISRKFKLTMMHRAIATSAAAAVFSLAGQWSS